MQLSFDLSNNNHNLYSINDFTISNANIMAYKLVKSWPDWPNYGIIILGEESSGKTHLAEIWRLIANAIKITKEDINITNISTINDNLIIDEIDSDWPEEELFHLLNHQKNIGKYILLTAKSLPEFYLDDLNSRLRQMAAAKLMVDDDLLQKIFIKLLSDHQIKLNPKSYDKILSKIERTPLAIKKFILQLEDYILTKQKTISNFDIEKLLHVFDADI